MEKTIEVLRKELGKPYEWGGTGPESYDCTGLVSKAFGLGWHPRAEEMCLEFCSLFSLEILELQSMPGDLVFRYRYNELYDQKMIDHVGIYTGEGTVIHASRTAKMVVETELHDSTGWNLAGRLLLDKCKDSNTVLDLKTAFLPKFTSREDFLSKLENFLDEQKIVMEWECKVHSDTQTLDGILPWIMHCRRKTSRLYNRVLKGTSGRDSMKHDLNDLVRYSIYLNLYYRILTEEED